MEYVDGMSTYRGYFSPSKVDFTGMQRTAPGMNIYRQWGAMIRSVPDPYRDYLFTEEIRYDFFHEWLADFWLENPIPLHLDPSIGSVAEARFDFYTGLADGIWFSSTGVSKGVIVHETIHYWNRKAGRYISDPLLDEKTAYGVQNMMSGLAMLRLFEDRYIRNPEFIPSPCRGECDPEGEVQQFWNQVWIGRANSISEALPSPNVSHGSQSDVVGLDGWAEIERITLMDVSCERLTELYVSSLNCKLTCPDGIPEVFR